MVSNWLEIHPSLLSACLPVKTARTMSLASFRTKAELRSITGADKIMLASFWATSQRVVNTLNHRGALFDTIEVISQYRRHVDFSIRISSLFLHIILSWAAVYSQCCGMFFRICKASHMAESVPYLCLMRCKNCSGIRETIWSSTWIWYFRRE